MPRRCDHVNNNVVTTLSQRHCASSVREWKSFVWRFGAFLRSKYFRKKKISRLEIVPITSLYYTTGTMLERIPSIATTSECIQVQWCFIQRKASIHLRQCSLENTLNRPSSASENVIALDKNSTRGLCDLGVTHILNLLTVCIKLKR